MGEALSHTFVRWDGKGVPRRIASEGVPMSVRLMQLADFVEVTTGCMASRARHAGGADHVPAGVALVQRRPPADGHRQLPLLHTGFVLSGRLHVRMNDGSALDLAPGEVFEIPPGHDAWVVGDDPCRLLDWGGKAREYVRRRRTTAP